MAATIEQVRTLVNDPAGAGQIFDDPHYQTIVDIETNVFRASATAARTLAAFFAQKVAVTAGPVRIANEQKFEHYESLARGYDQRAREGGGSGTDAAAGAPGLTGISNSEIESVRNDEDRYSSVFYRGVHDNPSDEFAIEDDETR